jgi:hypothetical protein
MPPRGMCLIERLVSPGKGIEKWIRWRQMENLSMLWMEVIRRILDIGSTLPVPGIMLSIPSLESFWAGLNVMDKDDMDTLFRATVMM